MKKKNIFSLALAVLLGFSSCDMDQKPYTSTLLDNYFVSVSQFDGAQKGIYSAVRSMTTGSAVLAPEFQTELFLPTLFFSNTYGDMSAWMINEGNETATGVWGNYYALIARANLIIDSFKKAEAGEKGVFSAKDLATCNAIAGEAYFARAYAYFSLAQFFCDAYQKDNAANQLGLPLQLTYAPSQYADTYPGRATLEDTYKQIWADLKEAADRINPNQRNPYRITLAAVTALEARIALYTKDYDRAIAASTQLIKSRKYPLSRDINELATMWIYDQGNEFIWALYQNFPDELGGALGRPFLGQLKQHFEMQTFDFHPSTRLLELYKDNDYRTAIYFRPYSLNYYFGVNQQVLTFSKFPGNRSFQEAGGLNTDSWYTNLSKPFGIAEQYLIAAEAYTERNTGNDLIEGAKYLNIFRASRHEKYQVEDYATQAALRNQVRNERVRELVGEGFHFFDLKRWGLGMNRSNSAQLAPFANEMSYFTDLKIEAGDYRFTWPIPKAEMDANPQLKGQQNPGY